MGDLIKQAILRWVPGLLGLVLLEESRFCLRGSFFPHSSHSCPGAGLLRFVWAVWAGCWKQRELAQGPIASSIGTRTTPSTAGAMPGTFFVCGRHPSGEFGWIVFFCFELRSLSTFILFFVISVFLCALLCFPFMHLFVTAMFCKYFCFTCFFYLLFNVFESNFQMILSCHLNPPQIYIMHTLIMLFFRLPLFSNSLQKYQNYTWQDITTEVEENKDEGEEMINRGKKHHIAPRGRITHYVWRGNAEIRFKQNVSAHRCYETFTKFVSKEAYSHSTLTHTETENSHLIPYRKTLLPIFIVCWTRRDVSKKKKEKKIAQTFTTEILAHLKERQAACAACLLRLSNVFSVHPENDLDWTSWSLTQKEHFMQLNICWVESTFLLQPLHLWVSVLREEWQIYLTVMSFHQWNIKMKDVSVHIYMPSLCWYTCFSSSFLFFVPEFWK